MKTTSLCPLVLGSLLLSGLAASAADKLESDFARPPADARPHTWWHWVNGHITKEGITADLEAMARVGVGGAQIFNLAPNVLFRDQPEPPGPVKTLSPEWRALTQHAIREAARVGVELTLHNCPGWSESGGPWVTPEQSMQRVVWSETPARGPGLFAAKLQQPESVRGFYRDIAVFAFPTLPGEENSFAQLNPVITASATNIHAAALLDDDAATALDLPAPNRERPQFLQFEFREPVTFGRLRLVMHSDGVDTVYVAGRIEASDDGKKFRKLADLTLYLGTRNAPTAFSFAATRARFVRLTMTTSNDRAKTISFAAVQLGAVGIPNIEQQAGCETRGGSKKMKFSETNLPPEVCLAPARLLNLTDKLRADGRLDWNVPPGNWTILRLGHTSTDKEIHPAAEAERGLECDKMSRAAVEAHFTNMAGVVIADAGAFAGKSLKMVLADSWEAGCQNWTPGFAAEFQRRRGYDPTPWLPALTGRAVGSLEESERFLWDFRRTIADLIAENHFGVFQELCAQHGMQFTAEAPGIGNPTIADGLQCKKYCDVPMGEFWFDGHNDSREPASAAHVYGRKFVTADFKALGDLNFCRGINRFVFHRYAHQPWTNRAPGVTMGPWGSNFERTQTWWEQSRAWMSYLQRCQFLLQQGLFVADVAYFYGEGAPNTISGREPKLPDGYDYDALNADALLNLVSVKNGRLVLTNGMSYRLLLLPDDNRMTPAVLEKIAALVKAGATVVGPRPEKSPSLADWPKADAAIAKLAAEVWGDCDGQRVTSHKYGQGRVFCGMSLAEVLKELGTPPDFSTDAATKFAFIHRRIGDADAYFVSSQSREPATARLTFRAGDRVPELWHPETGATEYAPVFTATNGLVTVVLRFDPAESLFVVFRKAAASMDSVQSFTRNGDDLLASAAPVAALVGQADRKLFVDAAAPGRYIARTVFGKTLAAEVAALPAPVTLVGPWTLTFPPHWGAPEKVNLDRLISWTAHPDEGVKYFSGTATYACEFEISELKTGFFLDLGGVKNVAEVTLNGHDLGILWKPPFRVDATAALRAGRNKLEVRVTNLWPNRLIGDAALPENRRFTWTTFQPYKPTDPLLESGLLGPVELLPVARTAMTEAK
ncbi:MAG: glycosyl hydrolase [Verrucomicrobia bacterium]|nr:glycosyl hydrolase [Verrucomicrobiota bacterium]